MMSASSKLKFSLIELLILKYLLFPTILKLTVIFQFMAISFLAIIDEQIHKEIALFRILYCLIVENY